MRILWCSWKDETHPLAGGAELYSSNVIAGLVRRGHHVTLATSEVDGQAAEEHVGGVHVIRAGGSLNGVYRQARLLYDRNPQRWDLIVDEINTRPFMAPTWTIDTPVVALQHQLCREVWYSESPLPIAVLGRFILEPWWLSAYRNTPVMCVSPSTARELGRYRVKQRLVLPMGASFPQDARAGEKFADPTMLFVGRVCSMKRPNDVLEAHIELRRTHPRLHTVFAGGGPELEKLRLAAADIEGVTIEGRVSAERKTELMRGAHVLAVTSVREGWGLVVSEAAAYGTVAVGYRTPGLEDSVAASGGVLCEPTPQALAAAAAPLLNSTVRPTGTGTVSFADVAAEFERHIYSIYEQLAASGAS